MSTEGQADMFRLSPAEELALAKTLPDGIELSPEAQRLYEAEGAARFAKYHRFRAAASIGES